MSLQHEELQPVEKYFLMLLYAPDSTERFTQPIRGKTWYQKQMFLLSKLVKELEEESEYNAHIMGSYSEIVEEVADQFYISGYTEKVGESIKLSFDGRKLAEGVWKKANDADRRYVTNVKMLLNDLSYYELLGLIYTQYPESAVNSEKQKEVDMRRLDIAISLLKKDKVSLETASKIANMKTDDLLKTLRKKGIDIAELETRSILQDKSLIEEIKQSREDSDCGRLVPWATIRNSQ